MKKSKTVIVFALAIVVSLELYSKPEFIINDLELILYDTFMKVSAPGKPDPRIIIVGVDQKAIDKFGRWPWRRDVIARLIDRLNELGASVIALDISFGSESATEVMEFANKVDSIAKQHNVPKLNSKFYDDFEAAKVSNDLDQALVKSISGSESVVLSHFFHGRSDSKTSGEEIKRKNELIRPFRVKLVSRDGESRDSHIKTDMKTVEPNATIIQRATDYSGFINIDPDPDGVIRVAPILIEYQRDIYPSFAFVAAAKYLNISNETTAVFKEGHLAGAYFGGTLIETNWKGQFRLKYLGGDETFLTVSVADIMNEDLTKESRELASGKIILVGAIGTALYDLRVTPIARNTAGVEIHATTISGILNNVRIIYSPPHKVVTAILIILLSVVIILFSKKTGTVIQLVLTFILLVGVLSFNYYMFSRHSIWFHSVLPVAAIIIMFTLTTVSQFLQEQKEKRFIKDAFSRYLSPLVIRKIIANPGMLSLGGEKRVMTAFFSDIEGFTKISERLSPEELVMLLNEYLTAMSDVIRKYNGTVDKYQGDAIIAFWGAPLHMEDHASLAVKASLEMQKILAAFREKWKEQAHAPLDTRMGLNSGEMVVGNMGSTTRMNYTIMGDSVNTAARLEGINKYYGTNIIVSETTKIMAGEAFLYRELDYVRVEGKTEPVLLFEVIDEIGVVTKEQLSMVKLFSEGITLYREGAFEKAQDIFIKCYKEYNDDLSLKFHGWAEENKESLKANSFDHVIDIKK